MPIPITGNDKSNLLEGSVFNDTISGGGGDDTISDFGGADLIDAGSGNDELYVHGAGIDTITGGSGIDFLQLSEAGLTTSQTLAFDFDSFSGFDLTNGTTVRSVEQIHLELGSGDDQVTFRSSGGRRQIIDGSTGHDSLIVDLSGETGDLDFLVFHNGRANIPTVQVVSNETGIEIGDFLNFNDITAIGGSGNDSWTSGSQAVHFEGRLGNDDISTGSFNDTILGGGGDDIISDFGGADLIDAGSGNDELYVFGAGIDTITGGSGIDFLQLSEAGLTTSQTLVFDFDSFSGFDLTNGTTVRSVEQIHLELGSGDDQVTFRSSGGRRQIIDGSTGHDSLIVDLSGKTGDLDFLVFHNGRANIPTVQVVSNETGIEIGDFLNFDDITAIGGSGNDSWTSGSQAVHFEGRLGNDDISTGSFNDTILGGGGDDIISDFGGADLIDAGSGNDELYVFGAGIDTITGGSGIDFLQLSEAGLTTSQTLVFDFDSFSDFDLTNGTTVRSVEQIHLELGSGDDQVTFRSSGGRRQIIDGSTGHDSLIVDLSGETGDLDFLVFHNGRANIPTVQVVSNETGIEIGDFLNFDDITAIGGSGNDSWTSGSQAVHFEGRLGNDDISTGSFNDTILGGGGDDIISDFGGADLIDAGSGNDELYVFGAGIDTITGGSGIDFLQLSEAGLTTSQTLVFDFDSFSDFDLTNGTTVRSVEQIHLELGSGDDQVTFRSSGGRRQIVDGSTGHDSLIVDLSGETGDLNFLVFHNGRANIPTVQVASNETGIGIGEFLNFDDITAIGGSGNDSWDSGSQAVHFEGRLGNDYISTGSFNDTIFGGGGDDDIFGGDGNDSLAGGLGDDLIFGGNQFDTIFAGEGNDVVYGGNGSDIVRLNQGNDVFHDNTQGGLLGRDTVFGGLGDDTIRGGNGDDAFFGEDGTDVIFGGAGNDVIGGGNQFDTIYAGEGNDTVSGGYGRDLTYLGWGDDLFNDNAQGGLLGRDTVFGGLGDDTIQGGNGDDVFYGEDGNDVIFARYGNDTIFGGIHFDHIDSGAGNDVVLGGLGRDRVLLGNGDDRYVDTAQTGELGNDTITGGAGADTFVFGTAIANDVITDFEVGVDRILLATALTHGQTAEQIAAGVRVIAQGVLFTFDASESILLEGLTDTIGLAEDIVLV